MQDGIYCLPEFTWVRLVTCNQIRMIESFCSQYGFVVEVGSRAQNFEIGRCIVGFPVFFQAAPGRFQGLKCRSKPRI